jgi:guanylate cyclase
MVALIGVCYLAFRVWPVGLMHVGYSLLAASHFWIAGRRPGAFHRSVRLLAAAAIVSHQIASLLLGGFVNSSGAVLWGLVFPVTVMLIGYGPRRAARWAVAVAGNIIASIFVQLNTEVTLPAKLVELVLAANVLAIAANLLVPLAFFLDQRNWAYRRLHVEQERAEALLRNILPAEIAAALKVEPRTIADHFEQASVLFADVVGFTSLAARLSADELVKLLNEVFTEFDEIVERNGLTKIKTIGDCYMVASGVPCPRPGHTQALVRTALEIRDHVGRRSFRGQWLSLRIGINSGPVVAGVIGRQRLIYDLWGDTVNVASRMESQGLGGAIQITPDTHELIRCEFECAPGGTINVKGKGAMPVWFVNGPKAVADRGKSERLPLAWTDRRETLVESNRFEAGSALS